MQEPGHLAVSAIRVAGPVQAVASDSLKDSYGHRNIRALRSYPGEGSLPRTIRRSHGFHQRQFSFRPFSGLNGAKSGRLICLSLAKKPERPAAITSPVAFFLRRQQEGASRTGSP